MPASSNRVVFKYPLACLSMSSRLDFDEPATLPLPGKRRRPSPSSFDIAWVVLFGVSSSPLDEKKKNYGCIGWSCG
ncbi:hypothetical protein CPC08DRAFT_713588 [Agrocybe pediades]|nr:hypothetical protein CPC08DRAFT_713588 [Agrocybe pediades]